MTDHVIHNVSSETMKWLKIIAAYTGEKQYQIVNRLVDEAADDMPEQQEKASKYSHPTPTPKTTKTTVETASPVATPAPETEEQRRARERVERIEMGRRLAQQRFPGQALPDPTRAE